MKKLLLSLILLLSISPCFAQGNPTCPTRPAGDNTNACASTAFVQQNGGSGLIVGTSPIANGTNGRYLYDNSGILGEKVIPASDLPPGVDTNTLSAKTANYSVATTDCGKILSLGGSTQFTLTVGAASGFDPSCQFSVVNIDTGRGKVMAINGITFPLASVLWPTMSFTLKNVNNVWTIFGLAIQWPVKTSFTFNIDTATGVDGSNDCLGALGTAGACATLNNAVQQFCQVAVMMGPSAGATFQTKTGQTHGTQPLCNYDYAGIDISTQHPAIVGDASSCANAANFTIDGGVSTGVSPVGITSPWEVRGMKITSSTNGTAVLADQHSYLYIGQNVTFPAVSGFHMRSFYLSFLEIIGSYCITGGAAVHAEAENQGQILIKPGNTVTLTGTPAFSVDFVWSQINALQTWSGTTFSGSATGTRFTAQTGGGINTSGGGAPFFPGNVAGAATTPGWYQ